MDVGSGDSLLDPSPLQGLEGFDPISPEPITPTKNSRKRKHSSYSQYDISDEEPKTNSRSYEDGSANRRARPVGTKRACNQCRQQKLKCNVVETPWTDCDRCTKHNLRCEITADFKRVGKRSQQAELEKNNYALADKVARLERELASYRTRDADVDLYKNINGRDLPDRSLALTPNLQHVLAQDDGSQDAALLLNLKQGHDATGSTTRASPAAPQRKLGPVSISTDLIVSLWEEYFQHYHEFLSVLDPELDTPDNVIGKSRILFWTVTLIASRHFEDDPTLFSRLLPPYQDLVKEIMAKPPSTHYVVKALCLLCYWPPPVSSTTADMTFAISGLLMKFAMQLGLHRPSHPMDFSRTRVQLREEDISDRLKTWAICNLVAQNVSTGYGQPPDTVYDSTLNGLQHQEKYRQIHTRLEIEKLADKITRTIYSPQHNGLAGIEETPIHVKAAIVAQDLQNLAAIADIDTPLNHVYGSAVNLHLRLFVFFDEPNSQRYQLNLNDLYNAATSFLRAILNCGVPLRYAPNYISQMMQAATVALLKLLHSFFAEYVDRDAGEGLFWSAIAGIRETSVSSNDLPQRLAEVFAQMWKADAERVDNEYNLVIAAAAAAATTTNTAADNNTAGSMSTKNATTIAPITTTTKPAAADPPGSLLTLKRRYRMSMSHVFDSIWRWKDELEGTVRAEKLDAAVQNPTSPHATTAHRHSFSAATISTYNHHLQHNNDIYHHHQQQQQVQLHQHIRRASDIIDDASAAVVSNLMQGAGANAGLSIATTSFGAAFGGGGAGANDNANNNNNNNNNDLAYANSYEFFDPVGWYLDGLFEPSGLDFS